jgi:hypothetical protein
MPRGRSLPRLALALVAGGVLATGCPTSLGRLSCSVQIDSAERLVQFSTQVSGGQGNRFEITAAFGDGAESTQTGTRSANFTHRYERGGLYVIQAAARNEETNDRYTCSTDVDLTACPVRETISDDFDVDRSASWTLHVVADSPTIRQAVSWNGSGGNAGGYRRMTHEFTADTSPTFVSIFVHHIANFGGAIRGPIDHLRYREDRIKFAAASDTSAVGGGAVILQNGIYHVASLTGGQFTNSAAWQRVDVTLRPGDFAPVPDFSANAAPMQFGYLRSNSNRVPLVIEHGIDNWLVDVCR